MAGLSWYLERARVMSAREILHRVGEALHVARLGTVSSTTAPVAADWDRFAFCRRPEPRFSGRPWDRTFTVEEAAALLDGRRRVLGCDWQWQPDADSWSRAPDTGRQWPRSFFARIDHRDGNPVGDARIVWEPSRLQMLVELALLAASEVHQRSAPALLQAMLLDWFERNPPYLGVHYVSAMECGLRLVAVCYAVDLVRRDLPDADRCWAVVVALVRSHAELIARRLSLYSSAGNHTLAEASGLIHAGVLFPELPHSARWRRLGTALFEREFFRQVQEDGTSLEQSSHYLTLLLDLADLNSSLLEEEGCSVTWLARAQAGRRFLAELGPLAFGDSDDGRAITARYRGRSESDPGNRHAVRQFEEGGYTVLRAAPETNLVLLFDHGPLGMLPACGHGHADALALQVRRGFRPLLLDPGTFAYTGDPGGRKHFRGTGAHNTVVVGRSDQAIQSGWFSWREPFGGEPCLTWKTDDVQFLLSRTRAYRRLGITHWRAIAMASGGEVLVWDMLDGSGTHHLSLGWHLGVGAVDAGANAVAGVAEPLRLEVRGLDAVLEDGWYSPAYGCRLRTQVLRASGDRTLPAELVTLINFADASHAPEHLTNHLPAIRSKRREYRSDPDS